MHHEMHASFKDPEGPPLNYFVPHFGEDQDIKDSRVNLKVAEGIIGKTYELPVPAKDPPPVNYFVPHFGEDKDVTDAKNSIAASEKAQGHELKAKNDGDGSYSLVQLEEQNINKWILDRE